MLDIPKLPIKSSSVAPCDSHRFSPSSLRELQCTQNRGLRRDYKVHEVLIFNAPLKPTDRHSKKKNQNYDNRKQNMVKKKLAQLNDSKEEQQECCADSNEWGGGRWWQEGWSPQSRLCKVSYFIQFRIKKVRTTIKQ